jgi:hypothetical protein
MNAMIPPVLVLIGFAALAAPPAVVFVGWVLWRALHDAYPAAAVAALRQPETRYELKVIRQELTGEKQ